MDARTRYTKNVIRQEFIKLLQNNNISKITVTSLCENAQINRATFYKYYDNPYDLLKKTECEILDNLQKKIESSSSGVISVILRIILEDIKDNRDLYTVIFSGNGDVAFRERVFTLCYSHNMEYIKATLPHLSKEKQEWVYFYMIEGCNGIINQWIGSGMTTDIDEVVSFAKKLGGSIIDSCSTLSN